MHTYSGSVHFWGPKIAFQVKETIYTHSDVRIEIQQPHNPDDIYICVYYAPLRSSEMLQNCMLNIHLENMYPTIIL